MNKMKLFKSVAASTLLLSAFASTSVFANPKTVHMLSHGSTVKVEGKAIKTDGVAALQAVILPDPLELARQYAPGTVEDWEATMKQYHELLKDKFNISAASADQVTFLEAVPVDVAKLSKEAEIGTFEVKETKIDLTSVSGVTAAGKTGSFVASDIKLDAGKPIAEGEFVATSAAVKPSPLFEIQLKLGKAVEDKDGAAIRETLTDLLKQYKEEIKQLQAEEKE
ncbi:hypothetical protein [Paenibacillus paeoniae]|uniref:Uncharacterized protein n=1 Tax=Paenibacillus paeoniae TaxID=2292705 RepID=A0A371PP34_9BACL|nr:hypothetical protein [Paenibacillus paeoniae]REK77557.1 hypothetical protein DX130_11345 [Paenibacillus paeoniae]